MPCDSQVEVRELLCVVRDTVTCISNTGMCVVCKKRVEKEGKVLVARGRF